MDCQKKTFTIHDLIIMKRLNGAHQNKKNCKKHTPPVDIILYKKYTLYIKTTDLI